MENQANKSFDMPDELKECITFHGHLCPGLVYGYLVAKAAIERLDLKRSRDEEVVAIAENDSCAVDGLQVLLGTTIGKGNLILKDYGKNAYTVLNRTTQRAIRFSRKKTYTYQGDHKDEFERLDAAISSTTATEQQKWRHKLLKARDLLSKPVEAVFTIEAAELVEPPYAPLARSKACAQCGEMTMATKMVTAEDGKSLCIPCSQQSS